MDNGGREAPGHACAGVADVVSIVEAENLGEFGGAWKFSRSWGEDPRDWMHKHLRGRVVARGFEDRNVLGAFFVVKVELDVEWGTFDDMCHGSGLEDHVASAEDWGEDVGGIGGPDVLQHIQQASSFIFAYLLIKVSMHVIYAEVCPNV